METNFEIIKLAALICNLCFLAYMGIIFSSKDALNKTVKLMVLTMFCIGTVFTVGMIRNGIHFNFFTHTVSVFSAIFGLVFLFAPETHWKAVLIKFSALITILSTIIYFYL